MMYPYITLGNDIEVSHSHVLEKNLQQEIEVHFERATQNGFDSARCVLPSYQWKFCEGFSEDEQKFFCEVLKHNAHLLFRYAEQGGFDCA